MASPNSSATDGGAIPCIVLGFTESEMELVKTVLERDGYADNLKGWILDTMEDVEGDDDSDSRRYDGATDRVFAGAADFIRSNPDVVKTGAAMLQSFIRSATKKSPH